MGGKGSGTWYRWNTKTTLDDCRVLNINRMQKQGAIKPNNFKAGRWVWTNTETNEEVSSIGYTCHTLDADNEYININYKMTNSGEKIDYDVKLVKTYPNYGGVRYWFICPVTGKRVAKLYRTPYDNRFISRHVYKLLYASQSESIFSKLGNKRYKLMRKLDSNYSFPVRPKGMHHKTFERIANQVHALDEYADYLLYMSLKGYRKRI